MSWAIVVLTVALIGVTAFYACQTKTLADDTKRMADAAERESRERQEREQELRRQLATTLRAELRLFQEQLHDLEPFDGLAITNSRNFARLVRLPATGRMFDVLLLQVGLLGAQTARSLADTYAQIAYVSTKADEFAARSPASVLTGETDELSEVLEILVIRIDQVLRELRLVEDAESVTQQ